MLRMRYRLTAVFILIIGACRLVGAEEGNPKGPDVVLDTAVTVLRKINAFFTGNLDWTMPPGKDPYKEDYTVDALGDRVPSSTLGKYDSGKR